MVDQGLLLLGMLWWSGQATGEPRCPPAQSIHIPEHTAIGTVLFSFETAEIDGLSLRPKDPSQKDYLTLQALSGEPNRWNITVSRDIDLMELNPHEPLVPETEENIQCNHTRTKRRSRKPPVTSLDYQLDCSVTISGQPILPPPSSPVFVAISDVNDFPPQFLCAPYHKEVNELTPVGSTVFTMKGLAGDADISGGISGYDLLSGGEGRFALTGASTEGHITVTGELDYDGGNQEYILNITVMDMGAPPLSSWTLLYLTVTDGDDQPPVFDRDSYHVEIPEQTESLVGQQIATVPPIHAFDSDTGINTTIHYELTSGHFHNSVKYFDIVRQTGMLIPLKVLDRLAMAQFTLKVKAYQVNSPESRFGYSTIVVDVGDVNNHKPVMSESRYTARIPEDAPHDYQVIQVTATDLDQGKNSAFKFVLIDNSGSFSVDPHTGHVTVKNNSVLDRETKDIYHLQVYAVETETEELYQSHNASLEISLTDVNDNTPAFTSRNYEFLVNSSQAGTVIGHVHAVDPDDGNNGAVQYRILFGTNRAEEIFLIDSSSGEIKQRTRPGTDTYIMAVEARDQPRVGQSRSSVTMVKIKYASSENKHEPVFVGAPYNVSISEGAPPGSFVKNIEVTDLDPTASLTLSITGGEGRHKFKVGQTGFQILTAVTLNRKDQSVYLLTITVSDGLYMISTTLQVNVISQNYIPPTFLQEKYKFSVSEGSPVGTVIGSVQAEDTDSGINAHLQYSIYDEWVKPVIKIDNNTGELSISGLLDREQTPDLSFSVMAMAGADTSQGRVASATVTVMLLDVNDNPPVILNVPDVLMVEEEVPPTVLIQLKASDADLGKNAVVKFSMTASTDIISINQTSGELYLTDIIDAEVLRSSRETLTVTAYNTEEYTDSSIHNPTVNITVRIKDKNDHRPVIISPVYNVLVPENHPLDTSVVRVQAFDIDWTEMNRAVYFSLGPEADGMFWIENKTGNVYLHKQLDRDLPGSQYRFIIPVYASNAIPDMITGQVMNTTATINITIMDVNDNAPTCSKDLYQISIPEDTANMSTVFTGVAATDADSGPNGQIKYFFKHSQVPFQIDQATGDVFLTGPLDYDDGLQFYQLVVVLKDQGLPNLFGNCTIEVTVTNTNDNAPEVRGSLSFKVPESSPVGTAVGQVVAYDKDGDVVSFMLDPASSDSFSINNDTGQITTTKILNRELMDKYTVVSLISDVRDTEGDAVVNPHTTTVEILVEVQDVNDNPPQFSEGHYYTTVQEGAPDSVLLEFSATDPDEGPGGEIKYSLLTQSMAHIFTVNQTSSMGKLFVTAGDKIDYHRQQEFLLILQAMDNGSPPLSSFSYVTVSVIDMNNHVPQFDQTNYTSSLRENQPAGTKVIQVKATDKDTTSNITYTFATAVQEFSIDPITGVIVSSKELDREHMGHYKLNISATDGLYNSYTKVYVLITDENDNLPVFKKTVSALVVPDNYVIGQRLTVVTAVDQDVNENALISYFLQEGEGSFAIDPTEGIITIVSPINLSHYWLRVFARDYGRPSLQGNMSITVKANPVRGPKLKFLDEVQVISIPEDSPVNSNLYHAELYRHPSLGNDSIRYEIITEDDGIAATFTVSKSGWLILRRTLDYENKQHYEFYIEASCDKWCTETARTAVHVTVTDVNDNAPRILPHPPVLRQSSDATQGWVLYQFMSTDDDSELNGNDKLTFTLLNNAGNFIIESKTGVLRTTHSLPVNNYSLLIQVSDEGTPPMATSTQIVIIIYEENQLNQYPQFDKNWFVMNIHEGKPVPYLVTDLNATILDNGEDEGIIYMLSQAPASMFFLDKDKGKLYLIQSLDHEKTPVLSLVLEAQNTQDSSKVSNVGVVINVVDVDDEAPSFPFHIYHASVLENATRSTGILWLQAQDPDSQSQLQYLIMSDNSGGKFRLEETNSGVQIKLAQRLDRETMPPAMQETYRIKVGVTDGQHEGQPVVVLIKVEDVNDNDPKFTMSRYTVSVPEDLDPCGHVITTAAGDQDTVDHGRLRYSIQTGNDEGLFEISQATGAVRRSCNSSLQLDREQVNLYRLTVTVYDSDNRHDTTELIIKVTDVNDNAPKFTQNEYMTTSLEGPESLKAIVYLTTTDADEAENALVTFSISPEYDPDGQFKLTTLANSPGYSMVSLDVVKPLDREKEGVKIMEGEAVYDVVVMATDGGTPAMSSSVTVSFYVKDINDSPPRFGRNIYDMVVSETEQVGEIIGTVTASDPDLPNNSHIVYSIQHTVPFEIHPVSGQLRLSRRLDASVQAFYNATVTASDGLHSSQASVLVLVTRDTFHFTEREYRVEIKEEQPPPFVTLDLTTNMERAGKDVQYHILTGNDNGTFEIEPASGVLICAKRLDREAKQSYNLVIGCDLLQGHSTRNKRSAVSTRTDIIISVSDINDNPPTFPKGNPQYIGIPPETGYGQLITIIQATDQDTGNHSALRFEMPLMDKQMVFLEPQSGGLRAAVDFRHYVGEDYQYLVIATDDNGAGLSSELTIKLRVLKPQERIVLITDTSPQVFKSAVNIFSRNLSRILDLEITVEKVLPHTPKNMKPVDSDWSRSDVYIHAVDKKLGRFLTIDELNKRIKSHSEEVDELFRSFRVVEMDAVAVAGPVHRRSTAVIALIIISCLLFVAILVTAILLLITRKKYKKKEQKENVDSINCGPRAELRCQKYMAVNSVKCLQGNGHLSCDNPVLYDSPPDSGNGDSPDTDSAVIVVHRSASPLDSPDEHTNWISAYEGSIASGRLCAHYVGGGDGDAPDDPGTACTESKDGVVMASSGDASILVSTPAPYTAYEDPFTPFGRNMLRLNQYDIGETEL